MHSWKNFFTALASLGEFIFPPALALYLISKNEAWTESSNVLIATMPFWEQQIITKLKIAGGFISPYILPASLLLLFFWAIGPATFTHRAKILWNALWIFLIFNIALFMLETADYLKMPFWPLVANLAVGAIEKAKNIFSFNIYVSWAAGIAFIYSLIIYFKDLTAAFINFFAGLLDRRVKPILFDELKTSLGVRLIKTPANLIPITPSLLGLIIVIFALGSLPLFLAPHLQDLSLTSVMNILGAAIITYGFIQIFGIIFIFFTGLVYYIVKKLSEHNRPPVVPLNK